jgi:subtilisin family serine protease
MIDMGRLLDSRFYTIALLLLVTLFSACSKEAETFVKKKFFLQETDDGLAPLYISNKRGLTPISANYLVVLKDNINPDEVDFKADIITEFLSSQKDKVFKNALKAFTIRLSSKDLQKVRKDPNVKYVEQDQVMKITATQFTAPWGLDRIDQVGIPLSGSYTYETTGSSVDAYIFDTGIRADHNEFIGRIRPGYNAISSTAVPNDDNGHGTHVSGILGGTRYGVAKGINIIPVKVLDAFGTGTISQIIAGIDWAIVNHTTRPSVGNVSISGPVSVSLDEAIRRAIKDGIVMCVAAGNNSVDVSTTSPGRIEEAIVVGSVTNTDQWSSFSNFGTIIDILAPGTSITSAWHTGINDINVVSGTSMATPHVAGAAALYLEKFPGTTPSNVQNGLKSSSVGDRILLVPAGTSNALLNINFLPPPPPIPLAPSLISPGNASTDHPANLTLSWSASANATTYGLQVSTNSNFSTLLFNDIGITSPSKLLSGLAQGTTYYWRTNATNVSGTSQWSVVNSFTTVAAPVVVIPSAPLLNSPSNMATSQVTAPTLVWSAVSGVTSYGLQVSSNVNFSTTVINQTGLTSLSSAVSGLTAGATYYWRVNASNSLGTGAWSTVYSFSTSTAVVPPGGSILSVPSLQTPADRATNISRTPTLTWSTVPGAVTFDIQISTATAFTSTAVNLTGVTSNSVQISTLLASRRLYYWRVRAVNGASVSGWSAVRRFTTVR